MAVNYTYCSDGELSTSGRLDDSSCTFLLRPANPGTPPPGSISIEQAIAAERSQPEVAAGRLVSAQLTSASAYFQPPNGEEVWVWELRVLGSFGGPCSVASDSPALLDGSTLVCGETTFVVLIDAMSGEVLLVTAAAYP